MASLTASFVALLLQAKHKNVIKQNIMLAYLLLNKPQAFVQYWGGQPVKCLPSISILLKGPYGPFLSRHLGIEKRDVQKCELM